MKKQFSIAKVNVSGMKKGLINSPFIFVSVMMFFL